jgi:hypothetical protein
VTDFGARMPVFEDGGCLGGSATEEVGLAELDAHGLGVALTVASEAGLELGLLSGEASGLGRALTEFLLDVFEATQAVEDLRAFLGAEDRGAVGGVGEDPQEIAVPKEHVVLGWRGTGFPDLESGYGGKVTDPRERSRWGTSPE